MANITDDLDWIDCNALRRDQATRGNGTGRDSGYHLSRYSANDEHAWRGALALIEPDGRVIELGSLCESASHAALAEAEAKKEAQERAKREAEEQAAKAAAEAKA